MNELGAGRYSEDGKWYRCYCRETSPDGQYLHVMYIDYGNTEWLQREKTVKLNSPFFKLRPQGVLLKLAGVKWKRSNNDGINSTTLILAKRLLMFQQFQARQASVDSSKPFLLITDLLQSRGETVLEKLGALPGIETEERGRSPVPPVSLSVPPSAPAILKPLKAHLSDVKDPAHLIWITEIKSTKFYFQLVSQESAEAIRQIQEMLLKCNLQNKVSLKDPKMSGLICCHKNGLERSRVIFESTSSTPGKGTVLHVDTGILALVSLTSFVALPAEAKSIPYQARPARLYGIPEDTYHQSSEALEFIIQQATQVLRAIVVVENPDESVVLELFNSEGENINMRILEMGKKQREASSIKAVRQMTVHPTLNSDPAQSQTLSNPSRSSPGIHDQSSALRTPVQVSPDQKLPQMRASPNQDSTRSQVSSYQAYTWNPPWPEEAPARTPAVSNRPASTRVQIHANQPVVNQKVPQSNPRTNQSLSSNPNPHFVRAEPNYGENQNQAFAPNQAGLSQNRASSNQTFPQNRGQLQSQATPNQTLPQNHARPSQNQASSYQVFAQNQGPPQNQASPSQTFPQNRASPNQIFPQNQGPPPNQASPTQAFPQNRASRNHNQGPPQNQALSDQAPVRSQASPQNQALPKQTLTPPQSHIQRNQAPLQNRVSLNQPFQPKLPSAPDQISASHDLSREPYEHASIQARPNQGFLQSQPNRAPDPKQMSSHAQVPSQNQAVGSNQLPYQRQPSPQAFSQPLNHQTIGQSPPQSNQVIHQDPAWTNQATPRNQVATHIQATLQNSAQCQTLSSKGPQIDDCNRPSQTTSQSSVNQRRAGLRPANKPVYSQNTDLTFAGVSTTSQDMTSPTNNAKRFEPNNPSQGVYKPLPQSATSQGMMSRQPTSRHSATTQAAVESQGVTSQIVTSRQSATPQTSVTSQSISLQGNTPSQGFVASMSQPQNPTSQRSTSAVLTSQDTTSLGAASQDSTSRISCSQSAGTRPIQTAKTRSVSTSSLNSLHSDKSTDKTERNETKQNLNQTRLAKDTGNFDEQGNNHTDVKKQSQMFTNLQSKSPPGMLRSETADRSSKFGPSFPPAETDKEAEMIVSEESLTGLNSDRSTHDLPGYSGKTTRFEKNLRSVKAKIFNQEKVLSCKPEEQREVLQLYKSREKHDLVYKVNLLENDNLMLEGEIKRNLEEKARLEKQLKDIQ